MDRFLANACVAVLALAATALVPASALAAGDAAKGADVAKRCAICHTFDKGGANKIGPNLFGVVGRAAGTVSGYTYSSAMKASGITWTDENLTEYVADPKKKVPGDKMAFAGISNPQQVADLVAYLDTLK